jgi:hypothetical protein
MYTMLGPAAPGFDQAPEPLEACHGGQATR